MPFGAARVLLSPGRTLGDDGGRSSVGRAPGCGPGCRGFESRRSPHVVQPVTCGFDRDPKFSLTKWLAFWLARLCDVDHMKSRGVWCRTALCSVEAVYPCAWGPIRLRGVAARRVTAGCRADPELIPAWIEKGRRRREIASRPQRFRPLVVYRHSQRPCLTAENVAESLECSPTKISHLELWHEKRGGVGVTTVIPTQNDRQPGQRNGLRGWSPFAGIARIRSLGVAGQPLSCPRPLSLSSRLRVPRRSFGPAPSITSQTIFTLHGADDRRLGAKARPARAKRRVSGGGAPAVQIGPGPGAVIPAGIPVSAPPEYRRWQAGSPSVCRRLR